MGFNFGAFVGGMSEQISENIESEKTFQREKDFRLEMLAEEEATKNRLAKSAERKKKNELVQELTENLAIHVGADNAAAFIKTYGVGGSNQFLETAKNYDGDLTTAINLPEIKNGIFGGDLANAPTMSAILPAKKVEPVVDTSFKFTKVMSNNLSEINRMEDGDEKDAAMTEWEQNMKAHETVVKRFADAARKEGTDKPEGEFYTIAQRQDLYKGFTNNAFEDVTGFAGAKEEYKEDLKGSNTTAFVDAFAMIRAEEFNSKVFNDVNYSTETAALFNQADGLLKEHALSMLTPLAAEMMVSGKIDSTVITDVNTRTALKPDGYMNEDSFKERVSDGTLKRKGVYIVKNKDFSLKVITYLGIPNIFDPEKRNYLEHHQYDGIPEDIFNKIEF